MPSCPFIICTVLFNVLIFARFVWLLCMCVCGFAVYIFCLQFVSFVVGVAYRIFSFSHSLHFLWIWTFYCILRSNVVFFRSDEIHRVENGPSRNIKSNLERKTTIDKMWLERKSIYCSSKLRKFVSGIPRFIAIIIRIYITNNFTTVSIRFGSKLNGFRNDK